MGHLSAAVLRAHPRKRWLSNGLWAVVDQGLYAGSNFLLNVMLARWLTPVEYGAFTVAFTVFLLLGTFHSALLTEPMLVFGPGKYRNRLPEYMGILISGHAILVAVGSLLLVLVAALLRLWGVSAIPSTLAGLALAAPFILLLWLMRRACYLRLQPGLAASGGLVNLILTVIGLIVLYQHQWLNTASALGLMGFASLVTGVWLAVSLHVSRPILTGSAVVREALTDHWRYGRWAAATVALAWVPGNIYYLLLPVWRGLEASAALKAMMNFVMPVANVNTALSVLLVPALVRARGNEQHGRHLITVALILLIAGSVGYWVLLAVFHHPLMIWVYRGQYTEPLGMWFLMLVILIAAGIVSVLGSALRALERPDRIFQANIRSAAVAVTVGVWGTFTWGVWGAGVGLALSSLITALAIWWYYQHSVRSGSAKHLSMTPMHVDQPHPALSRLIATLPRVRDENSPAP